MATIEERLERIEDALYKIRIAMATTNSEVTLIEQERRDQKERDWENEMGEDL